MLIALQSHWAKLIYKLRHFDITPAPPSAPGLMRQAMACHHKGDNTQAANYLRTLLKASPYHHDALMLISYLMISSGNYEAASAWLKRAKRRHPDSWLLQNRLGLLHAAMGNKQKGILHFEKALALNPDSVIDRYLLASLRGTQLTKTPVEYLNILFDGYADYFEKNLTRELGYRCPTELAQQIKAYLPARTAPYRVLDLGCGTGLMGQALAYHLANVKITGVDLSQPMLDKAAEKNAYTALHCAEILEFLQQTDECYDLITATDVFVYLGDLNQVVHQVFEHLKPEGYFAFTVEHQEEGDYTLCGTGRFQHSPLYLAELANDEGFKVKHTKLGFLRTERGAEVIGNSLILQKPDVPTLPECAVTATEVAAKV